MHNTFGSIILRWDVAFISQSVMDDGLEFFIIADDDDDDGWGGGGDECCDEEEDNDDNDKAINVGFDCGAFNANLIDPVTSCRRGFDADFNPIVFSEHLWSKGKNQRKDNRK